MNHQRLYYWFVILLFASCVGGGQPEKTEETDFKMIMRLWPAHHNDTSLRNELLLALREYPGTFDEVWFCMEFETLSMEKHEKSAKAMAEACHEMRKIGITPSIQGISIGHDDGFESGSDELVPTQWSTAVGYNGAKARTIHCPSQPAFLDYLEKTYALYAELCQPGAVFIDDDMRITHHSPVRSLCFCDTCIDLFNKKHDTRWNREMLVEALELNKGEGAIRQQWISFNQESLAGVARAISKGVHRVSPNTQIGIQQANFHVELLEGHNWKPSYDAIKEETGITPASRPGSGFYNDHSPRGMIVKAYDMARQIRRLDPEIKDICAEIEGYRHMATGKSPHGLCVESLLYLSMGSTQLSYAIICSASEPMQWYADNYFKHLAEWRSLCKEYSDFNKGTEPGGIDPYISPHHVLRERRDGEPFQAWTTTGSGNMGYSLATLGIPFSPDAAHPIALCMDAEAVIGLAPDEAEHLFLNKGILLDESAWQVAKERQIDTLLTPIPVPGELAEVTCFISSNGGRIAVIPEYNASINNQQRLNLTRIADWVAGNKIPVIMETMTQAIVVPRVGPENRLRSVCFLNCSISEQPETQLRLRGCDPDKKQSFVWKRAGRKDLKLRPEYDGGDVLIQIPPLEGWNIGWLAVKGNN